MKKSLFTNRKKQSLLIVPVCALMLGASQSQAQTTVGINFWGNYGTYNYGSGPVTATAFGVTPADWANVPASDYVTAANGSMTAGPAGALTVNWSAPNCWASVLYGDPNAANGPWNTPLPGDPEVLWGYLDDGNNTFQAPAANVSGLSGIFPHGYVVQTIAAEDANPETFANVVADDGTSTNALTYSYYWHLYDWNGPAAGANKGTVGLTAQSSVFTGDVLNLQCDIKGTTGARSPLCGFIITDVPVVTHSDAANMLVASGAPLILPPPSIIGVSLTYQWQLNGTNLPGAIFASYTNSSAATTDSGIYQAIVTSSYFPSISVTGLVASVTVVPTHPARTANWDADTSTSGVQDGSGTWNNTTTNWWSGAFDDYWGSPDSAVFGAGGSGAYTVTLGANITANAVTFSSGNYTITNTAGETLTLQGADTITADANATIASPFSTETNTFISAGTGALTISGALTCSQTFVKAGTLEVLAKAGDSPYIVTNGATLKIGYSTGGGYANSGMQLYGDGTAATTGLYLMGGTLYNVSGEPTLLGAPTTIRQYGSGMASLGIFDIHSTGLYCTAAASGSIIDSNIQLVNDGYGMALQVDAGANTATGDLILNGPLSVDARNGVYGLYVRGTGSMRLNAAATSTNSALDVQAGTVICGVPQCIGDNASLIVVAGGTLDFNGTSQTVSNAPALAGTLKMTINKGGSPGSTMLTVTDGSPIGLGGNLVVNNIGGSLAIGDTFTLFASPGGFSGTFTSLGLPAQDGLAWEDDTAVNGTIKVIAGSVPPSIVTDLAGTTILVYVGSTPTFSVTAAGDPTLHYQWHHNGTAAVGTDSPALTLPKVTSADGGDYYVTVTNPFGSVVSLTNNLDVVAPGGYDGIVAAAGPSDYWPLNETGGTVAIDQTGANAAAYIGGYALGQTGPWSNTSGVAFDGATAEVAAPYSDSLNPSVFSVEAWLYPGVAQSGTALTCALSCGQFASPRSGWLIYQAETGWNFRTYHGTDTTTAADILGVTAPTIGIWTHLAATWDGTTANLYVNGVLEGSQVPTTSPNYLPGASGGFSVGTRADNAFWWLGSASEVALYNRVLTPAEILAHATNRPILAATRSGASLVLTWPAGTGNLQSAPSVTGPYTNVTGATTPYTATPAGAGTFFRLSN